MMTSAEKKLIEQTAQRARSQLELNKDVLKYIVKIFVREKIPVPLGARLVAFRQGFDVTGLVVK